MARLSSTWTDGRLRRRQCPPTCVFLESQCDRPAHPIPSTPRPLLDSPCLPGHLCPSCLPGQTHVCTHAHNVLPCWLGPPLGSKHLGTTLNFNLSPLWPWASRDGHPGLSSVLPRPLREEVPHGLLQLRWKHAEAQGSRHVKVSDEPTIWALV